MKRKEVGLITCTVSSNGENVLDIKIYEDGTVYRKGNGCYPCIAVEGMSTLDHSNYFKHMMDHVPDNLLLGDPIAYQEPQLNGQLEYTIVFWGASTNGKTGEDAKWSKSTGIKLSLDSQTQFKNPIFAFSDFFVLEAAQITNDWYFDIMISTVYDLISSKLPEKTIINQPKKAKVVRENFENYVNQIRFSPRGWDLRQFVKGKTYKTPDGHDVKGIITQEAEQFNLTFEGEAPV